MVFRRPGNKKRKKPRFLPFCLLAAEIVQEDVFVFHAQVFEHFDDGLVHDRRATHIEFAVFRCFMVFQVVFVNHVVNEACVAVPVVFRQWVGQGNMPCKVREFCCELVEVST